ncbi:SPFH domain-containing protein [Rathayibacter sp. KR2-224]|uniref:SPFH domain-containing protein n=1 Tax=Rathayibacter sp. KR2-224 TaxID=3400913 RepID=UPI003C0A67A1
MQIVVAIIVVIVVIFVLVTLFRAIRIIPQARAGVVERLGRYHKTLLPGLNLLVPFVDRLRPLIDLREQVVSFPPQPVITEDNLVVSIDTVVYFQVTDARAATYEIANYLGAVEQLTTTTLRNVVGGMNLEEALTSRDNINNQLRAVLDEATGKWGIRVSRVELKAIDPPVSIQDSMEKQMRAERDRRALILTAEGTKQSAILTAEGTKQAAILNAEGSARAAVLEAEGQAKAIQTVFNAIHAGQPDNLLLAYQYLQTLPKIAAGASNKLWLIPSEFSEALRGIGEGFASKGANPFGSFFPPPDTGASPSGAAASGGAPATVADGSVSDGSVSDGSVPDVGAGDYSGLTDESAEAAVAAAEKEATRAEDAAPAGMLSTPVAEATAPAPASTDPSSPGPTTPGSASEPDTTP